MFTPTYKDGWKKPLIIGIVSFIVGAALLMTVEPLVSIGAIIIIVVPLVCLFRIGYFLFLNTYKRNRYKYVNKLVQKAENLDMVKKAIEDGTAEVFDNELVVITDEGLLAVTDTCDFYYFKDIEKIYATHEFEGRNVPKMNFIKLEESDKNYYIGIIEKWDLRPTHGICAKASQERLEKYKNAHMADAV